MMRCSGCIATLLASLLLASPALAQPKAATAKDQAFANDLVQRAFGKLDINDYTGAIDLFLEAYTIVPNPILLSNIGAAFEKSGKSQEALRYFCMYLAKDPAGTNAAFATDQARSLQVQLGNSVDDDEVCAPSKPKARPKTKSAKQRADEADPAASPKPPVKTASKPTPGERPEELTVVSDGGSQSGGTLKYVGLATGGLGLIGLGFGTYYGLKAYSISNEISGQNPNVPWTNEIRKLEADGERYEKLQIRALAAGGILFTAGIVLYLVGRSGGSDHSSPKVTVAPTTNGAVVFGRF